MKKGLLSCVALTLLLVGCGETNDYCTVTFNLNYDATNKVYMNKIVFEDTLLSRPEDPNRRDYVFDGWYYEEECINRFIAFNQAVSEDITLYAKWYDYNELTDDQKIDRFIEKLDKVSGKVVNTSTIYESAEVYYTPQEAVFNFYEKRDYNRYKDITTVDYYSETDEKFATQQFSYNDVCLYNIYQDIEGEGKNNSKKTIPLDTEKIENHLSIGFTNLNCFVLKQLSSLIKDNYFTSKEDYSFDCNYTHLDARELNYTFTCEYMINEFNEQMGSLQRMYVMEATVSFVNGEIKRSRVVEEFGLGIEGELQYYYQDIYQSTYSTETLYTDYNGQRLNLDNF